MKPALHALAAVLLAAATSSNAQVVENFDLREGALFLLTNQGVNQILAFDRLPDGTLRRIGRFETGGRGDGTPQGTDPATAPLASQGALVISKNGRFLFAVNPGNNRISVLRIEKERLVRVSVRHTGGVRPISLAVNKNRLFVLNEGGNIPNISGFELSSSGVPTAIESGKRALPSGQVGDPGQIAFHPDGSMVIVTEKATNLIATYRLRPNGAPRTPIVTASNGMTPTGIAITSTGHLIVAEAAAAAPKGSTLSSYSLSPAGVLEAVSTSVPSNQTGAGWIALARNGRYAFVSNHLSGRISSYEVDRDGDDIGEVELEASNASSTAPATAPSDLAVSPDGRYLYALLSGTQTIAVFRVTADGTLVRRQGAQNIPASAQGLVAN